MGKLPLLSAYLPVGAVAMLLVICGVGPVGAQPVAVAFTGLDSLRIWPGQAISISVEGGPYQGACVVRNLTNGDTISRAFSIADSVALIALPFGPGWAMGEGVPGDTTLQASYGHLIAATVEDVADTARIGVEAARIAVASGDIAVGSVILVSIEDRDRDLNTSRPDTVNVMWASSLGQRSGSIALTESDASTGLFFTQVPVACVLDVNLPSQALAVIDADTLTFTFWDSLAGWQGWEAPYGLVLTSAQRVATRTAVLSAAHSDYGDIAFLPLDGDSIKVQVDEPDLAGAEMISAGAVVFTPQGSVRDSAGVELAEVADGTFFGGILLGTAGGGLSAFSGDTLVLFYHDRADDAGLPALTTDSASLGAVVVSGAVSDTVWIPEMPWLLVDTIIVATGHHLRVAPGCVVAALPGRSVAWRVDGAVELGAAGNDSVWVRSAARTRRPGDWRGLVVAGSLTARVVSITDAETGVAVMPGASATLSAAHLANCGAPSSEDLAAWKRVRRGGGDMVHAARQARCVPAALASTDASMSIEQATLSHNSGFGVFMDGGECGLTNATISANSMDGLLAVGGECRVDGGRITDNDEGGVYAVECNFAMTDAVASGNRLQGIYAVGGVTDLSASELVGNGGGGLMVRDGAQSTVDGSLIARNFEFGIDEAWDCHVNVVYSTVAGNGNDGMMVDYGSGFTVWASTLAFNRGHSVHVGPWCTGDTLDARECWWGTATPPLDSTGTNNLLIYDGIDAPGRAAVIFTPWRSMPPPSPAPGELAATGGEVLTFIQGGGGPGDTLGVELVSLNQASARYAAVVVASSVDTLACLLMADESAGGVFRAWIALTAAVDLSSPDRLAATTADQIRAWWIADSTVAAGLTLPAANPAEVPCEVRLEAHPNPFRTSLVLTWRVPSTGAEMGIFDMSGRRMWHRGGLESGASISLSGDCVRAWPQGAYAVVLQSSQHRKCVRVIRLRP